MNLSPPDLSTAAIAESDPNGETGWHGINGIIGYVIVLALIFSTLTGLGPYRAFVGLGLIYVIHSVVTDRYSLRRIPRPHLLLYLMLIALWLVSQFYPAEVVNHRAVKNILYALVIAATINALPRLSSLQPSTIKKCAGVFVVVISAAVIGHASVFYTEESVAISRRYFYLSLKFNGLFDNIHFLGLFCCFSLPVLLLGWVWFRSWPARVAVVFIITLDLVMLFVSSSRPAWATLAVVTIVGCFLLLSKIKAWLAVGALGATVWSLVTLNLLGIGSRVTSLTSNIMKEDRFPLWRDTILALRDTSLLELALGHGIGGYAYHSQAFSSDERLAKLVFPHNFFLEWLFETGLIGCFLLTLGLGYVSISNLFAHNPDDAIRRSQIILGLTLVAVLLHGFFVLPFFYSRQILFLVTILVCLTFVVKDKAPSRVG